MKNEIAAKQTIIINEKLIESIAFEALDSCIGIDTSIFDAMQVNLTFPTFKVKFNADGGASLGTVRTWRRLLKKCGENINPVYGDECCQKIVRSIKKHFGRNAKIDESSNRIIIIIEKPLSHNDIEVIADDVVYMSSIWTRGNMALHYDTMTNEVEYGENGGVYLGTVEEWRELSKDIAPHSCAAFGDKYCEEVLRRMTA